MCNGFSTRIQPDLLAQASLNYNNFLDDNEKLLHYSDDLCSLIENGQNSKLFGFQLQGRVNNKLNANTKKQPSSIIYLGDRKDNSFVVRNIACSKNRSKKSASFCENCYKSYRNVIRRSNQRHSSDKPNPKIFKSVKRNYKTVCNRYDKKIGTYQNKIKVMSKEKISMRKKLSYTIKKCEHLEPIAKQWREREEKDETGFVEVNGIEKWAELLDLIFNKIDKEHANDSELASFHKELLKTELESLGNFNKKGDKRGMTTGKISTRILNYALKLADSMGKSNYLAEVKIRPSLPSWDTLTR